MMLMWLLYTAIAAVALYILFRVFLWCWKRRYVPFNVVLRGLPDTVLDRLSKTH